MINAIAIEHYRSLYDFKLSLHALVLVTGANGSGKSNFYRALRLLAETAHGGVVQALAREGGLASALWAGPSVRSRAMELGHVAIEPQGGNLQPRRLRLGFTIDELSYAIAFGFPKPSRSAFSLDPEIKYEAIWNGKVRRASILVERRQGVVKAMGGDGRVFLTESLSPFDSMLSEMGDPIAAPELQAMRAQIKRWRFYDTFRVDPESPVRQPQVATFTPVLSADGHDLASALQTIIEIGDSAALDAAISDAFPGSVLQIETHTYNGVISLSLTQHGLLRPLGATELSDGTLRYLLWCAALLSPRPAPLLVLNEPETSLHQELIPPLGRLIVQASQRSQIWVVSHAPALVETLKGEGSCQAVELEKHQGVTRHRSRSLLSSLSWQWPAGC